MFRRRIQHGWHRRIRDLFWPRSGWRRSSTYVAHRIGRLPGTSYSIAAGFACGAAVSFTPLIGFHFVLAAMLALIVRGNLLASALGTVVGNPWTFPGIWLATYRLGSMVLGQPQEGLTPERLTLMLIVEQPGQVFFSHDGGRHLGGHRRLVCLFLSRAGGCFGLSCAKPDAADEKGPAPQAGA
jgi:uncharacterized protein (DUF2062 family)